MSRNTADFKDRFEGALQAMVDNGAFDDRAERAINAHFLSGAKTPFGIEAAREVVFQAIMNEFLDTGWALFDFDGTGLQEVQRDDEADIFASDADALAYVAKRAAAGSQKHEQALIVHMRDAVAISEVNLATMGS